MVLTILFGLALLARVGLAGQAADYNISKQEFESHNCDEACQSTIAEAIANEVDVIGADNFDYDFYATPSNFSGSEPGDVLKLKAVQATAGDYKTGTRAFIFMYTTLDLDGSKVPATGFIAFPSGAGLMQSRNRKGSCDVFPLVAFAHGTTGVFAGCAPSNGLVQGHADAWQPLIARGYAVVATDYAGLGNNQTTHKYLSLTAQATDVYYSVVAARRLFGHVLSRQWISAGHSQGGGTVWKLAESDYVRNDECYLGTVAMAPATYFAEMLAAAEDNADSAGYLPLISIALSRAFAGFTPETMSALFAKRAELATQGQYCVVPMVSLARGLQYSQLVSKEGLAHDAPQIEKWQAEQSPALGARSPAPILVIQGLNDTTVAPKVTVHATRESCKAGNTVRLSLYPGMEHESVLPASEPEWLTWIDWRFGGGQYSSSECVEEVRKPYSCKDCKTNHEKRATAASKETQHLGHSGKPGRVYLV
ncbi:hypothetical protein CDD81_6846 [Ophiocordyceps australis]|uniref:Serine aminopeptidase S33 domain-containing protein n=1 Tax=Ophiocordyceps australis TaxID=1399860 RepID=A0A2C5Y5U3_9HYPO|nr:hypothetical protein CDD81_6846 [Ophiocordyceps australis]